MVSTLQWSGVQRCRLWCGLWERRLASEVGGEGGEESKVIRQRMQLAVCTYYDMVKVY